MAKLFKLLSVLLFILALIGVASLWFSDAQHHLHPTPTHQKIGAFPLMLIGLSYICFQFTSGRKTLDRVKGALLGTAFVLWGGEQLLSPGPLVTVMDSLVITIFVVDLVLIIADHLKRKAQDIP